MLTKTTATAAGTSWSQSINDASYEDPGTYWAPRHLYGTLGADTIEGGEGNDWIYGYNGSDYLWGWGGDDHIYGGQGIDSIQGGEGNDMLYGGRDRDYVFGGTGDDFLDGGHGSDLLLGDYGHDTLQGGAGRDYLDGGIHAVHGGGVDTLIGGADDDVFELGLLVNDLELSPFGGEVDTIADFDATLDQISVSHFDVLSYDEFVTEATSFAEARWEVEIQGGGAQAVFLYNESVDEGYLMVDADLDGSYERGAVLAECGQPGDFDLANFVAAGWETYFAIG